MPNKLQEVDVAPAQVAMRLQQWGLSIRTQRIGQQLSAKTLCMRVGVSDATLRRMERGDPAVSVQSYLTALWVLGLLDIATPPVPAVFWQGEPTARVGARSAALADGDYF